MVSLSRRCAAHGRPRSSTVEAAAPMGTAHSGRDAWPTARRAASSACPPSVKRTCTAFPAPCAAPSPPEPPAPSSAAVFPRVCGARASRATPCPSRSRALVARDCGASTRCAPLPVGSMGPWAVLRASSVPTASTALAVSRTASGSAAPRGNAAHASRTTGINVSWLPRGTAARLRAPRASVAICACPGAALSSGARRSATRSCPRAVPPGTSVAWVAPPSAPASASAIRWTRMPVARVGRVPPSPRT
jgi:hypothetical protein